MTRVGLSRVRAPVLGGLEGGGLGGGAGGAGGIGGAGGGRETVSTMTCAYSVMSPVECGRTHSLYRPGGKVTVNSKESVRKSQWSSGRGMVQSELTGTKTTRSSLLKGKLPSICSVVVSSA